MVTKTETDLKFPSTAVTASHKNTMSRNQRAVAESTTERTIVAPCTIL